MTRRLLVVYFSQSGQVAEAARSLLHEVSQLTDVVVNWHHVQPTKPYPFPWRSPLTFFSVMPQSVLGHGVELDSEPSDLIEGWRPDLIVFAYPVWFLMPAPPMHRFLSCLTDQQLHQTEVMTLCVCRGMWHHAARVVARQLARLGACHRLNVVATHQGPAWATFLSVPRHLLSGRTDRWHGVLPAAGIGSAGRERLSRIGTELAGWMRTGSEGSPRSQLTVPPAMIRPSMLLPESMAWPFFRISARGIEACGAICQPARRLAVIAFICFLIGLILIVLPCAMIMSWCAAQLFPDWRNRLERELSQPD